MNRSLLVSDRISLIPFIPILTRWNTSEVFTKWFSDITASSPSGSPSVCITASSTIWLWSLLSLIAVGTRLGEGED